MIKTLTSQYDAQAHTHTHAQAHAHANVHAHVRKQYASTRTTHKRANACGACQVDLIGIVIYGPHTTHKLKHTTTNQTQTHRAQSMGHTQSI